MASVHDIPVAHTPAGGYGAEMPGPFLDGCADPLVTGAPDLRGTWRVVDATGADGGPLPLEHPIWGHVERVEQAGSRVIVTSSGVVHDMVVDGTYENGVNDVMAVDLTTEISVVATYEDGVLVLRPLDLPGVEVRRRRDGEHLLWQFHTAFTVRMERIYRRGMSTRPLRQYYDPVSVTIPEVALRVEPWLRHRERFSDALAALSEEQWRAPTRCTAWDASDVIGHLVAVDSFWVLVLSGARDRQPPTTYVRGFDPSTGTDPMVEATRSLSKREMLDRFATGGAALVDVVKSFGAGDWDALGESPLGHLPARFLFGHAFWDSWLHERDIFEPLGLAPPPDPDELAALLCFTFVFAGLQGGLVDDPEPVGDGPTAPIAASLAFDELPDVAFRVEFDSGVRIAAVEPAGAIACGSAYDVVEGLTGRRPLAGVQDALPDDLAAQLGRALLVL